MKCPLCERELQLTHRLDTFTHKGVEIPNIEVMFYHCNHCNEDWTCGWQDDITVASVMEAYNEITKNETREG